MRQGRRKLNNKRAKQRKNIVENITQKLVNDLAELSVGLTPNERVNAHVEYYETCNTSEQLILLKMFKVMEDKELTELAL